MSYFCHYSRLCEGEFRDLAAQTLPRSLTRSLMACSKLIYCKGILCAWLIAATVIVVQGQTPNSDLTAWSLEELMKIEVTSVSKKEEKLFKTAAAVYVITPEEIRRSGLTTVPELLRLVPGIQVARVDSSKWAISARGFNGRLANKLLVLVDGRSVYSPDSAGVYWEVQDLILEDVERIEVIRGPGGTLWGANAVNGVINIITRSAKETQGGLMTTGGGSEEQGFGSARFGGQFRENAFYRIYTKYANRGSLLDAGGNDASDQWKTLRGGMRIDWNFSKRDKMTLLGDIFETHLRENPTSAPPLFPLSSPGNTPGEFSGANLLGRWNHVISNRSEMTLQIYFDQFRRHIHDIGERLNTFDIDLQHRFGAGERQEIIWGFGYRLMSDRFNSSSGMSIRLNPRERSTQLFSAFVQDEFQLIKDRIRFTLGTKMEHNDYTGVELQPNLRMQWTPGARQTIWAAVSRAIKMPSRVDRDLRASLFAVPGEGGLPTVFTIFGNPNTKSEEVRAYEAGYRVQPARRVSLDLTAFYNFYDRLRTVESGVPYFENFFSSPRVIFPLTIDNLTRGRTSGIEAFANWELTRRMRFHGSYSFLQMKLQSKNPNPFFDAAGAEGQSPRHQAQVHALLDLPRKFEFDTALYYVSQLPNLQIPSNTRLDARLGWRIKERLDLSVGLQNLLDNRHPEFGGLDTNVVPSQVKRSFYGKATWKF